MGMTMAELLAKQSFKAPQRGEEVEGTIIASLKDEFILDLGSKSEGVLSKKELPEEELEKLKVGNKLKAFVQSENESGQIVLGLQKSLGRGGTNSARFAKFEQALRTNQTLIGRVLEANKGGLMIEVNGTRGFLPTSQVALSVVDNLSDLVGKEFKVKVIELDPDQNRLIFTQVVELPEDLKAKINALKIGDDVEGKISSILSFGLVIKLDSGLEGFIHISEAAWERQEDLNDLFKVGDTVRVKVTSVDLASGRVNLSIKQLQEDPFAEIAKKYQADDIIKAEVSRVEEKGVFLRLDAAVEGFIPTSKLDKDTEYLPGAKISCIVDSVDAKRRVVNLAPFITSTKDLIYK
jgi:small subunit ribosomal protein S1